MRRFLLCLLLLIPVTAHAQTKLQGAAQRNDANKTVAAPASATAMDPSKCPLVWDPLKLCGLLTGDLQTDVKRVSERLRQAGEADLTYAIAKAKAANTPTSKVRLQCLTAVNDARVLLAGINLKDDNGNAVTRPTPAIAGAIEDAAELVDMLSPQGVLLSSCAGAAQLQKMTALQIVNAFVTGAAAVATGAGAGL